MAFQGVFEYPWTDYEMRWMNTTSRQLHMTPRGMIRDFGVLALGTGRREFSRGLFSLRLGTFSIDTSGVDEDLSLHASPLHFAHMG